MVDVDALTCAICLIFSTVYPRESRTDSTRTLSSGVNAYRMRLGRMDVRLSPRSWYFGFLYGYAERARLSHLYTVLRCIPRMCAVRATDSVSLYVLMISLGFLRICFIVAYVVKD